MRSVVIELLFCWSVSFTQQRASFAKCGAASCF